MDSPTGGSGEGQAAWGESPGAPWRSGGVHVKEPASEQTRPRELQRRKFQGEGEKHGGTSVLVLTSGTRSNW